MRLKVPFFGYVLAGIAFILPSIVLVAIMPFLVNATPIRAKLLREIAAWTGAEVKVAGAISVQNLFSLSVEARDVEIGQFKKMEMVAGMKAKRVVARIAWFNLLSGTFNFDKIKIDGGVFKLHGERAHDHAALLAGLVAGPSDSPFAALLIDDSLVAMRDAARKPYRRLRIKDVVARTAKAERRLVLSAHVVWNDKPVSLHLRSAFRPAAGARIPLQAQISSDLLKGEFRGEALIADWPQGEGTVSLSSPDLAAAAKWLGVKPPPALLAGRIDVNGTLAASEDEIGLTASEAVFAGQTAQAALAFKRNTAAPRLEGALAFDALDVKAILSSMQPPGSTDDGSQAIASLVETDLRVSAKTLSWDDVQTGPAALTVTARPERIAIDIAELILLGGEIRGQIGMEAAGPYIRASARLTAEDVDADQLLALAAQRDWLRGDASINIEAEAAWSDLEEIRDRIRAKARVIFPDGGQTRLNLPRLATAPAETDGWGMLETPSAAFDSLRFDTTLQEGRISFANLTLSAEGREVSGRGEIDLANRSLDWRFTLPREADAVKKGSGNKSDAAIGYGLSIRGPWARPTIRSGSTSGGFPAGKARSAASLEVLTPWR